MKKIYLSIVAAVSLMFVSCTADWLNTDPSTAVPSDDAIKNIDDAQVALNGIYRLASAHSYYGDNYLYYCLCIYNHRTTKTNQKYPSVNL